LASPTAASSCAVSSSPAARPNGADYILYYKPNIPLALIEAKDNSHNVGDGMQQALDYAATLDIPFVFSSNGDNSGPREPPIMTSPLSNESFVPDQAPSSPARR
jgi:type I site-specific restriction endonuclease